MLDYDHRQHRMEDRLLLLAEVFCIEIARYAIMSNHYHVVLNVNKDLADGLTDDPELKVHVRSPPSSAAKDGFDEV